MSAPFRKLLVPVDGSDPSGAAISLALRVALDAGAAVVFCSVADLAQASSLCYPGVDASIVIDSELEQCRALVAAAEVQARAAGVNARGVAVEGLRTDAILDLARAEGADLIVMGSHGRSGVARAFLGSTTEGVLRRSPVPVLVTAHAQVPQPA